MSHRISRSLPALAVLVVGLLCAAASVGAQQVDSLFQGFEPTGKFVLELDGQPAQAKIYLSDRAGAYLVMGPAMSSPLLINARGGTLESVSLLKVAPQDDGTIDLLADASFETLGRFRVDADKVRFDYKGQSAVLKQKPSLLGGQKAQALIEHDPGYGLVADRYQPAAGDVQALRAEARDVKVAVYFGSWCPVCGRLVPNLIRLERELDGSAVGFRYHGLPKPMSDDPVTQELDIHGVPTAIVYVGGREVGRMQGRELMTPESSLRKMLAGA